MKYIQFETNDGTYRVSLMAVAEDRADYYYNEEKKKGNKCDWHQERDVVTNDPREGIDWFANNCNFEDFETEKVFPAPPDKIKIIDGVFEIIEA